LKKGGKPAQVVSPIKAVQEENKAFLKSLFAGEVAPIYGARITRMAIPHVEGQASAGIKSYGRGMTNFTMSFGTATDYILETELGGETVVPKRFLNQRGDVHQELFKVGDVVITRVDGQIKLVNIGLRGGELCKGGRSWHEVYAWIPAEKVERAIKEGRLILSVEARRETEAAQAAAEAAAKEASAKLSAEMAAEAAKRAAEAAAGGGFECDGESLGTW
jgi:nucleoid-associated protein YgaU